MLNCFTSSSFKHSILPPLVLTVQYGQCNCPCRLGLQKQGYSEGDPQGLTMSTSSPFAYQYVLPPTTNIHLSAKKSSRQYPTGLASLLASQVHFFPLSSSRAMKDTVSSCLAHFTRFGVLVANPQYGQSTWYNASGLQKHGHSSQGPHRVTKLFPTLAPRGIRTPSKLQ